MRRAVDRIAEAHVFILTGGWGISIRPRAMQMESTEREIEPQSSAWLSSRMLRWPQRRVVAVLTLLALSIDLYLVLTNFCIDADGTAYVAMARYFADGKAAQALAVRFSPLYPWLISIFAPLRFDPEVVGRFISAAFGVMSIPLIYWLMREVFKRREIATAAAALAAIQPCMSSFAASVRTEAGYAFLMPASVYLLVSGVRRGSATRIMLAGVTGGLAYLYRSEGIGLLLVCVGMLMLGAVIRHTFPLTIALKWVVMFAAPFLIVAAPYLIYLHAVSGHWTVTPESYVVLVDMGKEAASNPHVKALIKTGRISPIDLLKMSPRAYLGKVGYELMMSPYYLAEAMHPALACLLVLGLWSRGRKLFDSWDESLLAMVALFFFFALCLFNTGPRFMFHIMPFLFGWTALGLETASIMLWRRRPFGYALPANTLFVVVALILTPATLWPLGYDTRGLMYAGRVIARRSATPGATVACDSRVAYYAKDRFIALPRAPKPDLCEWLRPYRPEVSYLVAKSSDEARWGPRPACLSLIRRYPRTGARYYDLFKLVD